MARKKKKYKSLYFPGAIRDDDWAWFVRRKLPTWEMWTHACLDEDGTLGRNNYVIRHINANCPH